MVAKGRCSDDAVAWSRRGGSCSEGCSWQVLASSGAGGHPAAVGARRDAAEGGVEVHRRASALRENGEALKHIKTSFMST